MGVFPVVDIIKKLFISGLLIYAGMEQTPTPAVPDNPKPTTLIMKGGGIKGLAYVGALEVLEAHGYKFTWFAGTSAGAICASLLAVGYTSSELKGILAAQNFAEFKDATWLGRVWNLFVRGGLYRARTLTKWLNVLNAKKYESAPRVWFKDIKETGINRLTVYASRTGKKVQVFDTTFKKSEDTPVSFAVRCSMAIPFFFTPKSVDGYLTFDGGLQNNYPVNALLHDNPGTEFIGLYLGPEIDEGDGSETVISSLFSILTESNDHDALRAYKNETIVIDPSPISTVDFSLKEDEKEFLLEGGRLSALKFLIRQKIIEKPADLDQRKMAHEKVREELRRRRKKRKNIRRGIAGLVTLLLATGIYYSCTVGSWFWRWSSQHNWAALSQLDVTPKFLTPKDPSNRRTPEQIKNDSLQPASPTVFVPDQFNAISAINHPGLIGNACKCDDVINITVHFGPADTIYAGFILETKYFDNKPREGTTDDFSSLTDIDGRLWNQYYVIDGNRQYYAYLFVGPIKEGTYHFKAKVH
jgi:predicted acylesterase/phospholipase RssA